MTAIARAFKSTTGVIAGLLILRSVSYGIVGLVLPLYYDSIGRSAGEWGIAAGALAFTLVFAEPLWGWASDRVGTAVPFLAAGLGSALLVPVFAVTGHAGILLAVQLGRGAVEYANSPAARRALAYSLGPGRKAIGIGIFQGCASAGGALGPLLGGFLIDHWGFPPAFLACSAISLLGVGVTLANRTRLNALDKIALRESTGAVLPPRDEPQNGHGFLAAFLAMAVMAACLFSGMTAGKSFVPLLGTNILHLPASRVAIVLGITGAISGPLTILTGRLADLWGRKPLIIGGLICVGAAMLGYAYLAGLAGLTVSTLLLYLGTAAAIPAGVALVSDVTPPARQGRMIGLYGGCENVGIMAGPLICGLLWDAAGYQVAFVACALLAIPGILAILRVPERR